MAPRSLENAYGLSPQYTANNLRRLNLRAGVKQRLSFKNAIMALGQDVAMLVADDPLRALEQFAELVEQIGKVKYYHPKNPRPSPPRVSKRTINKWIKGRADRMVVA